MSHSHVYERILMKHSNVSIGLGWLHWILFIQVKVAV